MGNNNIPTSYQTQDIVIKGWGEGKSRRSERTAANHVTASREMFCGWCYYRCGIIIVGGYYLCIIIIIIISVVWWTVLYNNIILPPPLHASALPSPSSPVLSSSLSPISPPRIRCCFPAQLQSLQPAASCPATTIRRARRPRRLSMQTSSSSNSSSRRSRHTPLTRSSRPMARQTPPSRPSPTTQTPPRSSSPPR